MLTTDTYAQAVNMLHNHMSTLAYSLDMLQALRAKRESKKSNLHSVQSGFVSSGTGPNSHANGPTNGLAPVGPAALNLGIFSVQATAVTFDLAALQAKRDANHTDKPTRYHAISRARMLWVRNPHSNSWGIELRAWRSMSLAEQRITTRKLHGSKA